LYYTNIIPPLKPIKKTKSQEAPSATRKRQFPVCTEFSQLAHAEAGKKKKIKNQKKNPFAPLERPAMQKITKPRKNQYTPLIPFFFLGS
jgi:hypothetical protein